MSSLELSFLKGSSMAQSVLPMSMPGAFCLAPARGVQHRNTWKQEAYSLTKFKYYSLTLVSSSWPIFHFTNTLGLPLSSGSLLLCELRPRTDLHLKSN